MQCTVIAKYAGPDLVPQDLVSCRSYLLIHDPGPGNMYTGPGFDL